MIIDEHLDQSHAPLEPRRPQHNAHVRAYHQERAIQELEAWFDQKWLERELQNDAHMITRREHLRRELERRAEAFYDEQPLIQAHHRHLARQVLHG